MTVIKFHIIILKNYLLKSLRLLTVVPISDEKTGKGRWVNEEEYGEMGVEITPKSKLFEINE